MTAKIIEGMQESEKHYSVIPSKKKKKRLRVPVDTKSSGLGRTRHSGELEPHPTGDQPAAKGDVYFIMARSSRHRSSHWNTFYICDRGSI